MTDNETTPAPGSPEQPPRRIAVLSGKGGVGKTNIALNLSLALADRGHRVLAVDGDLGLANLDVLLGLAPEHTLWDFLAGRTGWKETLLPAGEGLDIVPAASGADGLEALGDGHMAELDAALSCGDPAHDVVILDLGAGISATTMRLALLAPHLLVVTTPEPTALTDAYALMKVLHARCGLDEFSFVVNMVMAEEEAATAAGRLAGACRHFLGFEPLFLGTVHADPALPEAVCRQQALLRAFPGSRASEDIRSLACRIAGLWLPAGGPEDGAAG